MVASLSHPSPQRGPSEPPGHGELGAVAPAALSVRREDFCRSVRHRSHSVRPSLTGPPARKQARAGYLRPVVR